MINEFLKFNKQKELFNSEDRILIAVSGGMDSMALLQLLHKAGANIGVAHVNFQLRGKESDQDEAFVKQRCHELGCEFFSTRFDTNKYAEDNKLSIQMAARKLRYEWFGQLMQQNRFTKLATAHHFNDSIETVLLNWIRGGGIECLTGIKPKRDNIIRPLLFASRQQLVDYVADQQITWREDISNQTDHYQRNFIRHQVIPQLKRINPSLESTLQESQRKISGEIYFYKEHLETWTENHVSKTDDTINIALAGLKRPDGSTILYELIKDYGFNFEVCEQVIRGVDGQSGKEFFGSDHKLIIDREDIIIYPVREETKAIIIEEGFDEVNSGPWKITWSKSQRTTHHPDSFQAYLDSSKVKFPVLWRKWKHGDQFQPLGMNHFQKVSDYLINHKISIAEKESITVLESDGEIIWLVGHRIDHRFRITEATETVINFTLHS